MKKVIPVVIFFLAVSVFVHAQRGNNQVKLTAEVGFPGGNYSTGFGGFVKGLYGVGRSGQLTLMTGLSRFRSDSKNDISATTVRLIPFMAGYRQNMNKFYLEPQVGYGEFGGRITLNGDYARPSVAAFFWSASAGLNFKKLDVGVRYQAAHSAQGSRAGTWHNSSFQYTGVYLGFNLF
jgi:hypothetical protein